MLHNNTALFSVSNTQDSDSDPYMLSPLFAKHECVEQNICDVAPSFDSDLNLFYLTRKCDMKDCSLSKLLRKTRSDSHVRNRHNVYGENSLVGSMYATDPQECLATQSTRLFSSQKTSCKSLTVLNIRNTKLSVKTNTQSSNVTVCCTKRCTDQDTGQSSIVDVSMLDVDIGADVTATNYICVLFTRRLKSDNDASDRDVITCVVCTPHQMFLANNNRPIPAMFLKPGTQVRSIYENHTVYRVYHQRFLNSAAIRERFTLLTSSVDYCGIVLSNGVVVKLYKTQGSVCDCELLYNPVFKENK